MGKISFSTLTLFHLNPFFFPPFPCIVFVFFVQCLLLLLCLCISSLIRFSISPPMILFYTVILLFRPGINVIYNNYTLGFHARDEFFCVVYGFSALEILIRCFHPGFVGSSCVFTFNEVCVVNNSPYSLFPCLKASIESRFN